MLEITNHGYLELYDAQGNLVSRHTDPKEVYESASRQPPGTYTLQGRNQTIIVTVSEPDPDPDPIPDPDPDPDPDPEPDPDPIPEPGEAPYEVQGALHGQVLNWPAEPTTGSPVSVSNNSELGAALQSGAHIVLEDGDYEGFFARSSMRNFILEARNPGRVTFGWARVDSRVGIIRGVRINGSLDLTQGPQDILFDNVHVVHGAGTQPTVYIGSFQRVAFTRSTIVNTADAWPFLYAGSSVSQDFICAACFINATNGSANNDAFRMGHTSRITVIDSWVQSRPGGANQFRMHNEIEDILVSNNIFVDGATKMFIDQAGDGVGGYARRLTIAGNRYYEQFMGSGDGPFTSLGNNGTVSNFRAMGNRHYAGSATGEAVMANWNGGSDVFTDNLKVPYQAPPQRTAGASH